MAESRSEKASGREVSRAESESMEVIDPAGLPTARGGVYLKVGTLLAFVAWVVSMFMIIGAPADDLEPMSTAIWVGVGGFSAIGLFILGIWQMHRA